MRGATISVLPENFTTQQPNLEKGYDTNTAPNKLLLQSKVRCSKKALGFFVFAAFGAITLTTYMQILPCWANFDTKCSPTTVDVSTLNYRSNDGFYALLKDMKTFSPPTFRKKHMELCDNEHVEKHKFQYCLPITSQENRAFCAGVDRMEIFVRQSPRTLCRSSVLHLILSDVYEELEAAGASPSGNSASMGSTATTKPPNNFRLIEGTSIIMYSGVITQDDKLVVALSKKGYHLFQDDNNWRVCVAPTHPLASHLYDSDRTLTTDASSIPHITLIIAISEHESSEAIPKRIKTNLDQINNCSPKVLDAKGVKYSSSHQFYSMLQTMEALPPPTFYNDHKVLCEENDVKDGNLPYCLPISARSDAKFCAGADRIDLLVKKARQTVCLKSVLQLLVTDIFNDLQAAGGYPVVPLNEVSTDSTNITFSALPVNFSKLKYSLLQKGYHLYGADKNWRVCVSPIHPLAASLYDPYQAISKAYTGPHVILIPNEEASDSSEINARFKRNFEPQKAEEVLISDNPSMLQETKGPSPYLPSTGCEPDSVKMINNGSGGEFYSMMESTGSLPQPRFEGEHEALCSSYDRKKRGFSYCLPIFGQKDTSRCRNADRMDILLRQSPKKQCFSSVLHLLLKDVFEELKAVEFSPILTFGTLLGAVRDGGIIPFTEDVDIAYHGKIVDGGELDQRLWRKGYHLFQYNIFRVCVAPIHPLASQLYNPEHPIVEEYQVPYVDLYSMEQEFGSDWSMQELKSRSLPNDRVQPFSQVTINGEEFDTVHDPNILLLTEYGADYMTPQPRHRRLLEFK